MLFNVYYDETRWPLVDRVKYIINETTQEKLTLEEFVKNLVNYDEVNHIIHMSVFFPHLEQEMLRQRYENKHTQTKHFAHYRNALKPKCYTADIYETSTLGSISRTINKMRVGSTRGSVYFIEFKKFAKYCPINTPIPEEEIKFASFLSSIRCTNHTAAGAMREKYKIDKLFKLDGKIAPELGLAMLSTCQRCAVIEAYELGYHKEGWSYDVNSMYLAMMTRIKHLPNLLLSKRVKKPCVIPPGWYGWHRIGDVGWEVLFEGESLKPDDYLVPPESKPNPLLAFADAMFSEKQRSKEKGECEYRFYKQQVNSAIGSFAQKNRLRRHYTYWDDTEFRREDGGPLKTPRYDVFSIITALARRYIRLLMDKARECGCHILQVNTDGFITDKPIPQEMLGAELGELRFDKHLTNLYIFSANRYAADGVQCISGLPEGMYDGEHTVYHYYQVRWSPLDQCYKLIEETIDLMVEIRELEDMLNEERQSTL